MRGKLGLVLLVMACFAFNSVATRYLVSRELLDAGAVTLTRFLAGAATLAVLLAREGRRGEIIPSRADVWPIAALGIYAVTIAYGYRFITAAAGTFVFYALVITTMTLGGPRPTLRALTGALIALAGVGVLAFGRTAGTAPLGVALLAMTGASWGAYSLILRHRGAPLATNTRAFVGFAALLPLLAAATWGHLMWSWQGILIGLFMGSVTTALAYALWARVLPELSPIEAGTFQLLVPILTAAAGVALLGEPFGPMLAIAGALVLAGMVIAQNGRATRTPSAR